MSTPKPNEVKKSQMTINVRIPQNAYNLQFLRLAKDTCQIELESNHESETKDEFLTTKEQLIDILKCIEENLSKLSNDDKIAESAIEVQFNYFKANLEEFTK
jgi:hypothetical protein